MRGTRQKKTTLEIRRRRPTQEKKKKLSQRPEKRESNKEKNPTRSGVHLNALSPDPLTILTRFKELRTKPQLTLPSFIYRLLWRRRFPTRTSAGPKRPEREKKEERMLH
ncbi:hypothetical protein NDU88_003392 [Pleurodeles waltl]|uniref:Uncharacterized protein n=1 Tax=Pleurodeles waltl TaxID=8319 RepID=A0AAV7WSQ1_PLEWA|nr:hypothetical protein NDU88_003392 [Pleurodeles waltl]